MNKDEIKNEYFDWLYNLVCGKRYSKNVSYKKLLMRLHDIEFTYLIPRDENRASDGEDLRYRFAITRGYPDQMVLDAFDGPASVFEMLVGLSIRCEETIMDDPAVGDRTGQWFWGMIVNLGLGAMFDSRFDKALVDDIVDKFLNRQYEPDGRGGLFTIDCDTDLRNVEIWHQMCWYLDGIT